MTPAPTPSSLPATVVIDYQNVHLTGWSLFGRPRNLDKHETLLDPLLYAQQLLRVRNAKQQPGFPPATLRRVIVYRGQHTNEQNSEMYAYGLASKARWERDARVEVNLRPLTYYYEYGADNRPVVDIHGRKKVIDVREKGIDVLVALRTIREVRNHENKVVVIASTDSDLAPVLDEAVDLRRTDPHTAKIETVSWWAQNSRNQQLRSKSVQVWNTRLDEDTFTTARDHTDYRTRR